MHRHVLHSLLLTALAGTLLFGSCGLVGDGDSKAKDTYFRAALNGKKWSGNPDAVFSEQGRFNKWLALFADSLYESGYRERLSIHTPFRGVREYNLSEKNYTVGGNLLTGGGFFSENDYDVTISSYSATDDSSVNRLTITKYDSTTGVLEGTFRTTVVVDSAERVSEPGEPPRRRPDTLRFTDGEFRVKTRDLRDQ
jgi:hypothetical protein